MPHLASAATISASQSSKSSKLGMSPVTLSIASRQVAPPTARKHVNVPGRDDQRTESKGVRRWQGGVKV